MQVSQICSQADAGAVGDFGSSGQQAKGRQGHGHKQHALLYLVQVAH